MTPEEDSVIENTLPPVNANADAEELPKNMVDTEGEFEAAEEGTWKATGADSMPGLDEESGEPMPDMGEEVNEKAELPTGDME